MADKPTDVLADKPTDVEADVLADVAADKPTDVEAFVSSHIAADDAAISPDRTALIPTHMPNVISIKSPYDLVGVGGVRVVASMRKQFGLSVRLSHLPEVRTPSGTPVWQALQQLPHEQ